jgi:hypothetical protein
MSWYDAWQMLSSTGPIVSTVVLVIAFFLWKDYKRENRLQDRVEVLEKDQKEILLPLVERCSVIIAQNTAVMMRLEKALDRNGPVEVKDERCLLDRLLEDAAAHRQEQ